MKSLLVSMILIASVSQANAATRISHCKSDPSKSEHQVKATLTQTDSDSGKVFSAVVETETGAHQEFSDLTYYGKNNFGIIISVYSKGSEFTLSGYRYIDDPNTPPKWTLTVPALDVKGEPMLCD